MIFYDYKIIYKLLKDNYDNENLCIILSIIDNLQLPKKYILYQIEQLNILYIKC